MQRGFLVLNGPFDNTKVVTYELDERMTNATIE